MSNIVRYPKHYNKILLPFTFKHYNKKFCFVTRNSSTSSTTIGQPVQPKRSNGVGGFRGGIIGFLLGLTVAGGTGYFYLLEEYKLASSISLDTVEELQKSTDKVRDYAKKIETIESELNALQSVAATTDQIKELRSEYRKLYDNLNIQHLELKAYVWGLG
nr:9759_t:CDS:2 [Entrophospora candida]